MQRGGGVGLTPPTQNAALFSSLSFGGSSGGNTNSIVVASSKSRPGTSSGDPQQQQQQQQQQEAIDQQQQPPHRPNVLTKERRPSLSKKSSFSRRRASSSADRRPSISVITGASSDNSSVPPLPDFALAVKLNTGGFDNALASPASIDSFSKMLGRTAPTPVNGYGTVPGSLAPPSAGGASSQSTTGGGGGGGTGGSGGQSESNMVHVHIQEMANKRITTLDYLRKAHEGRVYWFNTLLFDKPDLARMPYFDSRKLSRRATNYLLLGLSLPTVIDLNSGTPLEFLRSLNTLLTEFEAFQQLHSENGGSSGSLSRARLPQMFRRAAPGSKTRRASGANDIGYPLEPTDSGGGGGSSTAGSAAASSTGLSGGGGGGGGSSNASVINFAASETDLLPGEEYTHLLTPSLPFDPDFFETFATLCDVLIDCYTRLLSLVPTPRECSTPVAELFTKADARVRKIIIQGVVKEFEDTSRSGLKTEVANVGKVVLGGLM